MITLVKKDRELYVLCPFLSFLVKLGLSDIMIAQFVALKHERKFVWRSEAELVAWFKPSRGGASTFSSVGRTTDS